MDNDLMTAVLTLLAGGTGTLAIKGIIDLLKGRQDHGARFEQSREQNYTKIQDELIEHVNRLERQGDRLEERNQHLESRVATLESQIQALQDELWKSQSEVAQLKRERAHLQAELEDAQQVSLTRQTLLNEAEVRMTALKGELLKAEQRVQELTHRLAEVTGAARGHAEARQEAREDMQAVPLPDAVVIAAAQATAASVAAPVAAAVAQREGQVQEKDGEPEPEA